MSRLPVALGRYRHYKGGEYEVIGVSTHTETGEQFVVYRALYGEYGVWVRPLEMFAGAVEVGGKEQPRFEYEGPSDLPKLSPEAQADARAFLLAAARPLEQALYSWEFAHGGEDDVYVALGSYASAGGGFGRGLEPDLRTPTASVLATTTALQTLRLLDAPADHTLVRTAMSYLRDSFDADNARWPLIPPTANDAPHAPWWTAGPDHAALFRQYAINPLAEALAHLYHYRELADEGILTAAGRALLFHLGALAEPLNMNEILCAIRLVETPAAPEDVRAVARDAVLRSLPESLARSAEAWESYSLQPLAVAPSPRSPFAPAVAELIPANLDFRVAEQAGDGSWQPAWSWGNLHPDAWPQARRDWQGILTLEALRQLSAYGRLAV